MKSVLAAIAFAAIGAGFVAAQSVPVVHVENWSDLTCPSSGNPVIRLFSADRRVSVTCE